MGYIRFHSYREFTSLSVKQREGRQVSIKYKKYYVGIKQVVYERALVEAESEEQAREKVNDNVENFDWQVMDTSDFEICEVFDV